MNILRFGQITDEPAADYHAAAAVGSHKLADFCISPLLYERRYITHEAELPAQSPTYAFGEFFHALTLEGEEVAAARFAEKPEGIDRRTKDGKTAYAAFEAEAAGRTIISHDDSELAWRMMEAVHEKKTAHELFQRGGPEVVFRKQMAAFAVQSRCDWFDGTLDAYKRPLIVDLKTITTLGEFDRQFHNYGYYRQAAFYQLVVHSTLALEGAYPRFLFVVVEKEEPFQAAVREPDEVALDIGRREVMRDLARLKTCYESGVFPGEPDTVQPVRLPDWMIAKRIEP